jgi:hypothetical protein
MDMEGPMPEAAWFEIRDASGERLESVPADVDGGGIYAHLPAFVPGTQGPIELCMRWPGGQVSRIPEDLRELPTSPGLQMTQIG